MLSYLQRDCPVSLTCCIKLHILLTLPWGSITPIMIVRLMFSLKKAVSFSVPGSVGQVETPGFARWVAGGTKRVRGDDMALTDLLSEGTSGLSRNDSQI
jgi:hypothetical protein